MKKIQSILIKKKIKLFIETFNKYKNKPERQIKIIKTYLKIFQKIDNKQ